MPGDALGMSSPPWLGGTPREVGTAYQQAGPEDRSYAQPSEALVVRSCVRQACGRSRRRRSCCACARDSHDHHWVVSPFIDGRYDRPGGQLSLRATPRSHQATPNRSADTLLAGAVLRTRPTVSKPPSSASRQTTRTSLPGARTRAGVPRSNPRLGAYSASNAGSPLDMCFAVAHRTRYDVVCQTSYDLQRTARCRSW